MRIIKLFILGFFFILFKSSYAIKLVRDCETEQFLQELTNPLAQNMELSQVNLYLVDDDSINAFVYGGNNVFINLGLFTNFKSLAPLEAVITHELGHIKGAHLIKGQANAKKNIIAQFSILAAAILTGSLSKGVDSDLILSTLSLSSHIANRNILSYTRQQEREADYYAVQTLNAVGRGTSGMQKVFDKISQMQALFAFKVDKYATTHPLSQERLSYAKESDKITQDNTENNNQEEKYNYIRAKILAYYNTYNDLQEPEFKQYNKINSLYFKKEYQEVINEYKNIKINNLSNEARDAILQLVGKSYYFLGDTKNSYKVLSQIGSNCSVYQYDLAISAMNNKKTFNKALPILKTLSQDENMKYVKNDISKYYALQGDKIESMLYKAEYYRDIEDKKKLRSIIKNIKNFNLNEAQKLRLKELEEFLKEE